MTTKKIRHLLLRSRWVDSVNNVLGKETLNSALVVIGEEALHVKWGRYEYQEVKGLLNYKVYCNANNKREG